MLSTQMIWIPRSIAVLHITSSFFPLRVAIDGNNLEYQIYYSLFNQPFSKTFSYAYVNSVVNNIFKFLEQSGIVVEYVCFDLWSEKHYKLLFNHYRTCGKECRVENGDYYEIDDARKIRLFYRDSGILLTTMRWTIQNCIYQRVGKDKIYMCGMDSDRQAQTVGIYTCRDIASLCIREDLYILSGDSDYFLFPVNGVIWLFDVFTASTPWAKSKTVRFFQRKHILEVLGITVEEFLQIGLLLGNDYAPDVVGRYCLYSYYDVLLEG